MKDSGLNKKNILQDSNVFLESFRITLVISARKLIPKPCYKKKI
jgi:hypothetical protein